MGQTPVPSVDPAPVGLPVPFVFRWARFSDLAPIAQMYRRQSPESRSFFHPYPFDRLRLGVILGAMYASQRVVRRMLRWWPNFAFVIVVAAEPTGAPVGFGTVRFVARRGEETWARFGFMIDERHQGHGVGSRLAQAMYRSTLSLGVRRGGGTILEHNQVSMGIAEKFGFRFTASAQADPRAPRQVALHGTGDLEEAVRHGPTAEPVDGHPED
jgi:RimJ/RimL family protein N-acetyltransferase